MKGHGNLWHQSFAEQPLKKAKNWEESFFHWKMISLILHEIATSLTWCIIPIQEKLTIKKTSRSKASSLFNIQRRVLLQKLGIICARCLFSQWLHIIHAIFSKEIKYWKTYLIENDWSKVCQWKSKWGQFWWLQDDVYCRQLLTLASSSISWLFSDVFKMYPAMPAAALRDIIHHLSKKTSPNCWVHLHNISSYKWIHQIHFVFYKIPIFVTIN